MNFDILFLSLKNVIYATLYFWSLLYLTDYIEKHI